MKTNKDLNTLYKYYMELADKIIERQEQIGEPPDEWETIDILRGRLLCFSQILDDEVKSEQAREKAWALRDLVHIYKEGSTTMLNTRELFEQLKEHWNDNEAKLIIHALTDDLIDDKAKLMNIVEVAQETQAMNWQPVFETFFLEDMGIPMEAFIKFIQENGYKPTLGLDWLYMGTDEEGIEQYAYISHYIEFFKINGVM